MNMDYTVFKECDAVQGGGSLPKYSGRLFSLSFLLDDGPSKSLRHIGKCLPGCMTSCAGRQNRHLRYFYSRFHRSVVNLFCGIICPIDWLVTFVASCMAYCFTYAITQIEESWFWLSLRYYICMPMCFLCLCYLELLEALILVYHQSSGSKI